MATNSFLRLDNGSVLPVAASQLTPEFVSQNQERLIDAQGNQLRSSQPVQQRQQGQQALQPRQQQRQSVDPIRQLTDLNAKASETFDVDAQSTNRDTRSTADQLALQDQIEEEKRKIRGRRSSGRIGQTVPGGVSRLGSDRLNDTELENRAIQNVIQRQNEERQENLDVQRSERRRAQSRLNELQQNNELRVEAGLPTQEIPEDLLEAARSPLPSELGRDADPDNFVRGQQPQPEEPSDQDILLDRFRSASRLEQAGIQGEAQIQSAAQDAISKAAAKTATQIESQRKLQEQERQQRLDRIRETANQFDESVERLKDFEIDPTGGFRGNTGKQVLAGISAFLGGFGGALTGQPNSALQQINRTIDRDIEGQINEFKADRQSAEGLKSVFAQQMEIFGNEELAREASRLALRKGLEARIKGIAANAESQAIKNRSLQLLANTEQQNVKDEAELLQGFVKSGAANFSGQDITNLQQIEQSRLELGDLERQFKTFTPEAIATQAIPGFKDERSFNRTVKQRLATVLRGLSLKGKIRRSEIKDRVEDLDITAATFRNEANAIFDILRRSLNNTEAAIRNVNQRLGQPGQVFTDQATQQIEGFEEFEP